MREVNCCFNCRYAIEPFEWGHRLYCKFRKIYVEPNNKCWKWGRAE